MSAPLLSVDAVTWAPRKRAPLVLHETSFSLMRGQVMGVVGPNGAGKTTLLRMIYGYHRPSSGDILVDGGSVKRMAPGRWRAR